ncbi:MAG TPA: mechanosensitive ion channel domain-containing protein [Methanocella sp.]|nr:mechanosensitive ion channel domain-containing protein [Methanocella sp.]
MPLVNANPADAVTRAALDLAGFFYGNWNRILLSAGILVVAYVVIRLLKGLILRMGKDYRLPPQTVRMIGTAVTYGVFVIAFVSVLAVFNIQLYSLILSLGIISVVVVLGSQLLISNLLGGAVVYVEKPFLKGDLIKVGDSTGVVQGISIRATTLRGLNGLDITIPNSTFLTTSITNYTRTRQYLIKVPFTMPRDINMAGLVDAIKAHASSIPGLATDRGEELYKMGISSDDIQYELHFWVSDPRQSDDARSRAIDIIGQFYAHDGHDGHNVHHGAS